MQNRKQKIRLGIFLVVGLIAIISILAFFTAQEFFKKEDTYFIAYSDISVSGLEVGSPVKYMGINTGTIKEITIDPENVNKIIVELALKPETPIKENVHADIISLGITGLKAIELSGASNEAEPLKPGSFIRAGSSFAGEITGKAEIIAQKAEQLLNNLLFFTQPENLNKFTNLAELAGMTILNIDSVIAENRSDIRQTVIPLKDISNRLDQTSRVLLSTIETVQLKVENDTINEIFTNLYDVSEKLKQADINSLVENIAKIAGLTEQLINRVDNDLNQGSKDFNESLHLLKLTLENLNQASIKINNDPSILIRGDNLKNAPDYELKK